MNNHLGGFFVVPRALFEADSPLSGMKPMTRALFLWMLAKANWRDRDKLKRGQFVTTIDEMRDAMTYMAGYRRVRPSRDEIRNCYEALTRPAMITTTKTTRGMIITICNYDEYQNPANYEAHKETHSENATKPSISPHDTEQGNHLNQNQTSRDSNAQRKAFLLANKTNDTHSKTTIGFVPPTVEEIEAYCCEHEFDVDAGYFFDYYETRGWFVGKNMMVDWQAAVRNWERNGGQFL